MRHRLRHVVLILPILATAAFGFAVSNLDNSDEQKPVVTNVADVSVSWGSHWRHPTTTTTESTTTTTSSTTTTVAPAPAPVVRAASVAPPPTTTTLAPATPPTTAIKTTEPAGAWTANWDAMSECEDNDDPDKGPTGWQTNTGNGYYGGLQFSLSTWRSAGGEGRPDLTSREYQIQIAEQLVKGSRAAVRQHWPHCSRYG